MEVWSFACIALTGDSWDSILIYQSLKHRFVLWKWHFSIKVLDIASTHRELSPFFRGYPLSVGY